MASASALMIGTEPRGVSALHARLDASMADASSTSSGGLADSPRQGSRRWISLLAELPYFAIVVIGIVGVSWTNLLGVSVATYWVTMTPIAAVLCILVGWAHLPEGRRRFEM